MGQLSYIEMHESCYDPMGELSHCNSLSPHVIPHDSEDGEIPSGLPSLMWMLGVISSSGCVNDVQ